MRGTGRAAFAAILLLIAGTLNIVYGIGALDHANILADDTRFILDDLNTLGWVLLVLGMVQLTGAFSLLAGNRSVVHGIVTFGQDERALAT